MGYPAQLPHGVLQTLDLNVERSKRSLREPFLKVTSPSGQFLRSWPGNYTSLLGDDSGWALQVYRKNGSVARFFRNGLSGQKIRSKSLGVRIQKLLNSFAPWRFEDESCVMIFGDAIDDFWIDVR